MDGIDKRLPGHRETVLVALGKQLPVVGELALDQSRREPKLSDRERHLAVVDNDRNLALFVGRSSAPGFDQRPLRNNRLRLTRSCGRYLANREPVGIGPSERDALAVDVDQNPGK